ncbi:PAS domain S-box protein [Pseudodesulfovibrio senegalensis]|uniref:histidine kinase n=2 Tax=Pseudodesulfovibrio senegalensis TaxID=1721087 RepID=A0A6N6N8B8_9BACT|nr:PAS domain S-box protein [Pseudodesulfovibrio senegalensis]
MKSSPRPKTHAKDPGKAMSNPAEYSPDLEWSVFENSPLPVYETNIQGMIWRYNKAFAELFGYSTDEMRKLADITQLVSKHDLPNITKCLEKTSRNAPVKTTIIQGLRKDGSHFFYRPFPQLLENDRIRVILLDVTEMREAQEALKKSEERYAFVVQGVNDGIWDVDLRTGERFYSPRYKSMLGYGEDDFPESPEAWQDMIHPDDKSAVIEEVRKCKQGEVDQFQVEYRIRHKDNSWRWILARGGNFKDKNGRPYRISGTHTDISKRKKTEDALRESEEMHSALSRAAFEGIAISENGCILAANHAASALFGYEHGEYIGQHTHDLVIPEHREIVRQNIKNDYEKPYEVVGVRKDGSTFNVQLQGKVFQFKGRKTRVTGIRDISRRIEAESRYQSLFENAIEGIFQASSDGKFLAVNQSLANILGYGSTEELMDTVQDVGSQLYAVPEEYARLRNELQQHGQVTKHEIQLVRKDGTVIWASESSRLMRIGEDTRYEGFVEDITERKANERTSRVLYDISNAVSRTRDLDELFTTIHGILNKEIDATNFYIALLNEDRTQMTFPYFSDEYDVHFETVEIKSLSSPSLTLQVIQSGKPLFITRQKIERKESEKTLQSIGTPAAVWLGVPLSIKGKPIGAMAVQHYSNTEHYTDADIKLMTAISEQVALAIERKATESELFVLNEQLESIVLKRTRQLRDKARELETANKRLQELDKLKSAIISSISHELRTPLTSIRGFAKLIRKEFQRQFAQDNDGSTERQSSAERIVQNLEIVESEGERLTRLVNGSLDLSKIESGHMQWNDQSTRPEKLVQLAHNAVSGQFASTTDLRLDMDIHDGLPSIHVDPDRIQQVLINLLHNAAKFTRKGTVTVGARLAGKSVRFFVTDTGVGIPETEQTQIFERFHKREHGDTLADIREGAGLGLAICREIVSHYNGRIWVESQLEQGSSFIFEIPGEAETA